TRRIIGFGIQAGVVDGVALCGMFKQAIRGAGLSKYISSDHDPLYRFHQWQANLRILDVIEIKTVPYVPMSHPFIERLIGTASGGSAQSSPEKKQGQQGPAYSQRPISGARAVR